MMINFSSNTKSAGLVFNRVHAHCAETRKSDFVKLGLVDGVLSSFFPGRRRWIERGSGRLEQGLPTENVLAART